MSRQYKILLAFMLPLLILLCGQWGCKKKDVYPAQQLPKITSLSPTSAIAGTPLTIRGVNLKSVDSVLFGTALAAGFNAANNTDTAIHVIVPDSLPLGQLAVQVYLKDGKGYSAFTFTVLLTPPVPKIDSVSPATGFPGDQLIIYGTNFAQVTNVQFAGVEATFAPTLDTNGKIAVIVPMNATGGPQYIKVINGNGSDSVAFNVNLAPVITSVTPGSGKTGDPITIKGLRFNNITSVKLGAVSLTYTTVNDSTITFNVPSGGQNGNITVTNALGTAVSPQGFVYIVPISLFIFDETLASGWSISSYTANTSIVALHPASGASSLETDYTGGFGAFRISNSGSLDLSSYSTLRLSIYGGPGEGGKQVKVTVNGDYGNGQMITLTEGSYTDYFIPLTSFQSPAALTEIVVQEFSGNAPSTIYIDNIGLN